jgi:hypothetical protein
MLMQSNICLQVLGRSSEAIKYACTGRSGFTAAGGIRRYLAAESCTFSTTYTWPTFASDSPLGS